MPELPDAGTGKNHRASTSLHKRMHWIALGVLAAATLVIGLAVALPHLLSTDYCRNSIASAVAEKTGGRLDYERLTVAVLPRPHVRIHAPRFALIGSISIQAKSVSVYPALRALLGGAIHIQTITVHAPETRAAVSWLRERLAHTQAAPDQPAGAAPVAAERFFRRVPKGVSIRMQNGTITVTDNAGATVFRLADLRFSLRHNAGRQIEIVTESSSTAWKRLRLDCCGSVPAPADMVPRLALNLEGAEIDIAALKTVSDAHLPDLQAAHRLFAFLRAGTLEHVNLSLETHAPSGRVPVESVRMRGRLRDGVLWFARPAIAFDAVTGDFTCIGGLLQCRNWYARYGSSRLHALTLDRCLLNGNDRQFHVQSGVTAAAGDILALLAQFSADRVAAGILRDMRRLDGTLHGVVTIEEKFDLAHTRVRVDSIRLRGRHNRLPCDFAIESGRLQYENRTLTLTGITGAIGDSTFRNLSATLDLVAEPQIQVSAGPCLLQPAQVNPLLHRLALAAEAIPDLSDDSSIQVDSLSVRGPLLHPAAWHYTASARMPRGSITAAALPARLHAADVSVQADHEHLRLNAGSMMLLDGACILSLCIDGPLRTPRRIETRFTGSAGIRASRWLFDRGGVPLPLRLRSPLAVTDGRVVRTDAGGLAISGVLRIGNAVDAAINFDMGPERLQVHELFLSDNDSKVRCTMSRDPALFSGSFTGTLHCATLEAMGIDNPFLRGWISGDMAVRLPRGKRGQWRARGSLRARDVHAPGTALVIKDARLAADSERLSVETLSIGIGNTRAQLSGTIHSARPSPRVDADVFISGGSLSDLQNIAGTGRVPGRTRTLAYPLPFTGEVRITANGFTTHGLTWETLRAAARFSPMAVDVGSFDARLCGMPVPGSIKLRPAQAAVFLRPTFSAQPLSPLLDCLTRGDSIISGTADFAGRLSLDPTAADPLATLSGTMSLQAREGRIYRYGMLAKLFGFLNLTEVFRGRLPDFGTGMSYESIQGAAVLDKGVLNLQSLVVDAQSMKMVWEGEVDLASRTCDITVLAAPLRTIDFLVSKVPVLRTIVGGHVLALPVNVSGPLDNPNIHTLLPSVVGTSLISSMKDILLLPVELLHPSAQHTPESLK